MNIFFVMHIILKQATFYLKCKKAKGALQRGLIKIIKFSLANLLLPLFYKFFRKYQYQVTSALNYTIYI